MNGIKKHDSTCDVHAHYNGHVHVHLPVYFPVQVGVYTQTLHTVCIKGNAPGCQVDALMLGAPMLGE